MSFFDIWRCFFTWAVKPNVDFSGAEAIVAFSFGLSKDKKGPGKINESLAQKVLLLKYHHDLPVPVLAQWEIATVLKSIRNFSADFQVTKHRKANCYLDSYEVFYQIADELKERSISRIILVAHPWHIWRIQRIFNKAGFTCLVPDELWRIGFDRSSGQWWTRNLFFWIIREIPARLLSLYRGWI